MIELRDPNERRVGPYVVVASLARGATSEVVRALDADLDRTVAIKILSPDFVKDPETMSRFERESRALTQLKHPNIARVFETGVTMEDQPYFVMEFVDGRSLMEFIRDKVDLPFSRQADLIVQAAEGLRAARNQNIIHRDIKPANMMVDRDFRLKIVDFGLAKVIGEDVYQSVAGRLIGTPTYMAPEVAMGRSGDHRSDIYSLGASFYHLLTGQPPFDGETPAAVMTKHVNSPLTPLYMLNPGIPADLCETIEKMMAKDPNRRFADYDELIVELKAALLSSVSKERRESGEGVAADLATEEEIAEVSTTSSAFVPISARTAGTAEGAAAGEVRKPGRRPSYVTEGKVSGISRPKAEPKPSGSRWLMYLALIVILGVAGLGYLAMSPSSGGSPGGLRALVQSLLGRLGEDESPEERYQRQYVTTRDNLVFLAAAVREYALTVGNDPASLDGLVGRKLVSESELLDGFGNEMRFEPGRRRIRSAGSDGVFGSSDDFVSDIDGQLLMHPPKPERLDVEDFTGVDQADKDL
jgi:serine/threonine protein kinase